MIDLQTLLASGNTPRGFLENVLSLQGKVSEFIFQDQNIDEVIFEMNSYANCVIGTMLGELDFVECEEQILRAMGYEGTYSCDNMLFAIKPDEIDQEILDKQSEDFRLVLELFTGKIGMSVPQTQWIRLAEETLKKLES